MAAFDIKAELEVQGIAVKEMNGHFVKRVGIWGLTQSSEPQLHAYSEQHSNVKVHNKFTYSTIAHPGATSGFTGCPFCAHTHVHALKSASNPSYFACTPQDYGPDQRWLETIQQKGVHVPYNHSLVNNRSHDASWLLYNRYSTHVTRAACDG